MSSDVYTQLARFLDQLPGGYPATEDGLELRILQRLFTPEEAEIALHLELIAENARVIAHRADKPLAEVKLLLEQMERKGLLFAHNDLDGEPRYMAAHFAVGIFEFQLHKMDEQIAGYFKQYFPNLLDPEIWRKAPQLRTIPVQESIELDLAVMDYERAEELVLAQDRFSLATCICRQEKGLLGEPCSKPEETCLGFGSGADFYVRNGLARYISQQQALDVLALAQESGLVLQPDAAQQAGFICCCCGCCCELLTNLKRHPNPGEIVTTSFVAVSKPALCSGCELCFERCQMEALFLDEGVVQVDKNRCIGCGLCVTECPSSALSLKRKSVDSGRRPPKTGTEKYIRLAKARGVLDNRRMAAIALRSVRDRLLARLH
ncbi:MAG: 4Fe-4S dicluster domain-containing protein [Anaerolineales bacterium]